MRNILRWFFSIVLVLFGGFLAGLTVNSFGKAGNFIMHLIGYGCCAGAVFIIRNKKRES